MFEVLKEYCKSGYVTRKELEILTGGIINTCTIARLDSEGKGICKTNTNSRAKKSYKIDDVIDWLEKNTNKQ